MVGRPRHLHCTWCGIVGHNRRTCHVMAEGRRGPDAHDIRAAELVAKIKEGDGKVSPGEVRALLARELRREARGGV